MKDMAPCLESWATEQYNETSPCIQASEEILDVLAYRKFVTSSWQSGSASAVLVACHNLVTDSISRQYLNGDRRQYYCTKHIQSALEHNVAFKENIVLFGSGGDSASLVVQGVPGLGSHHRLVDCTPPS